VNKEFNCFVDGNVYDFEEFFWRTDGRLCFCSVSVLNKLLHILDTQEMTELDFLKLIL